MDYGKYIDDELLSRYEFLNYGHALEILSDSFPVEWEELKTALTRLRISVKDLQTAGGNESPIPKKFDDVLYPLGWREIRITGDLLIKKYPRLANKKRGHFEDLPDDEITIAGYSSVRSGMEQQGPDI